MEENFNQKIEEVVEVECNAVASSIFMLIGCLGVGLIIFINLLMVLINGFKGFAEFVTGNIFNVFYLIFLLTIYLKAKNKDKTITENVESLKKVIKVFYVLMIIVISFALFGILLMFPLMDFIVEFSKSLIPEYNEIMSYITYPLLIFVFIMI